MNSCILELNLKSSGQRSFLMLVLNVLFFSFWKTTAGHACTDAAVQTAYDKFLERNQMMCYWMWSTQMNLGCKGSLSS